MPVSPPKEADAERGSAAEASGTAVPPPNPLDQPVIKRPTRENRGTPVITTPHGTGTSVPVSPTDNSPSTTPPATRPAGVAPVRVGGRQVRVYLSPVHYAEGSDRLTNADLIRRFPDVTSDDIIKRTGIESRPYCNHKQNALTLAIDAATQALAAENLTLDDLTGIVCHTTTPPLNTPSMACMVLNALDPTGQRELMVYDVNAACSGWLYALDAAHTTPSSTTPTPPSSSSPPNASPVWSTPTTSAPPSSSATPPPPPSPEATCPPPIKALALQCRCPPPATPPPFRGAP